MAIGAGGRSVFVSRVPGSEEVIDFVIGVGGVDLV